MAWPAEAGDPRGPLLYCRRVVATPTLPGREARAAARLLRERLSPRTEGPVGRHGLNGARGKGGRRKNHVCVGEKCNAFCGVGL
ncbi:hypothetical protein PICMEDRAFT_81414 [Pichia membranifaciens NRRL Y-2026]|uniref:Uncharacterized protein n=1 Tax=Pichia membranifaciens NRRL Y-2026 TaxID=763406 RepID=A0A1E3NQR0_9ASCO|nr:hypothetical protein PICMEDRAFT_81414 [Pichia membranifaciens NRRL Y-2026]ODQ48382.1 hypothetical protein PICMEDRAFT_81414 [Pichia membranifaciens NRRL Y-2026]